MLFLRSFNRFILISLVLFALPLGYANASTVQNFGVGTAVTTVDFNAEFESPGGTPHLEDELSFSNVPRINLTGNTFIGFAGVNDSFGMYAAGSGTHLDIATQDGSDLFGIEFNIGTGWSGGNNFPTTSPASPWGYWESYRDNSLVGNGGFQVTDWNDVISFRNTEGFDLLRIAMHSSNQQDNGFGLGNAIAIDHVVAQSLSPVPVPAAIWLFGTALIGFVGMSRKRKVS